VFLCFRKLASSQVASGFRFFIFNLQPHHQPPPTPTTTTVSNIVGVARNPTLNLYFYDTMKASKRDQKETKRRKLLQKENNEELSNTTLEQCPEEVMVHIISYICDDTIRDVARLFRQFGRVSKFCRKSCSRFPQLIPIRLLGKQLGKPSWVSVGKYRLIAFLCRNQTKVESFGELKFSNDLNANIILYMLQTCNISCLYDMTLLVNKSEIEEGFPRGSQYDKTIAMEAGLPEHVVLKKNIGRNIGSIQDVQRQIFQMLNERTRCLEDLHVCTPSIRYFQMNLPKDLSSSLERLNLQLGYEAESPTYTSTLSHMIEALPRLKYLCLSSGGDCNIRSKSLTKLRYSGRKGPTECICPALEDMTLDVKEPGTSTLLSNFSHAIKKFHLDMSEHEINGERWHRPNTTARHTQIVEEMTELRTFKINYRTTWLRTPHTYLEFKIRSKSVRSIVMSNCSKDFRIVQCICPSLEVLKSAYFTHSKTSHFFFANYSSQKKIEDLVQKWVEVNAFDCPCSGVQVPDDCLLRFRCKKDDD